MGRNKKKDREEEERKICRGCRLVIGTQDQVDDHMEEFPRCKNIVEGKYKLHGSMERRQRMAIKKEEEAQKKKQDKASSAGDDANQTEGDTKKGSKNQKNKKAATKKSKQHR